MGDEKEGKPNFKVIEFDKFKNEPSEGNRIISEMFKDLAERAARGDINDFVITFKSRSKGIESMISAEDGISRFDFVGYIGMLEVVKQKLIGIMSQMTRSYEYEEVKKKDKKDESTEPEKTDS